MLKRLLFVLLFSLGPLAAASAQAPSAEALSIAEIYHANSGVSDIAINHAFAARSEEWRAHLTSQPTFQLLPHERRAAVLAVFETAPGIFREELAAATPLAVQAFALEIDQILPARHLPNIAEFLSSPAGQKCVRALIGFRNGDLRTHAEAFLDSMSRYEQGQLDRFLYRQSGRVLSNNWININRAYHQTAEAPFAHALVAAGARIEDAYCAAMAPYCEPEAPSGAPSPVTP